MFSVGAVSYRAQAVQSGDAGSGREVSVRASSHGNRSWCFDSQFLGQLNCPVEQSLRHVAFHWGPVDATFEFDPRAFHGRREPAHECVHAFLFFCGLRAHVHVDFRVCGHGVGGGPAGKYGGCHGGAGLGVGKSCDDLHLVGKFESGVDALFWFESSVGCLSADVHRVD